MPVQLHAQWSSSQILSLLRLSILSTTALTDILPQHGDGSSGIINLKGCEENAQTEEKISSDAKKTVKITIRKSNNKILFAEAGEGFVNFLFSILALPLAWVPGKFIVTNNLIVTPFSFISSLSFLQREKVPMDDIEVRVVNVGHEKALRLLEASLTSGSVLSSAFSIKKVEPKKP
ncbi:hypothetical protein GIB67_041783 [Kingdonia uniflora]|uniref:Uncharacterized protein n=1 Tax=Kingdonia uniflora TaxID=39325 RepID=A0A7J7L5Q9_9MAGN|nr:hypothetical protein GIB67_041783 [Kingdonia uniflora]